MTFKLTRGETFSLALEAFQIIGDASLIGATCEADLKRALNTGAPGDAAPIAATFTVSALVANVVPGGGPGWILTLSPEQTESLIPGSYVTDMKITLATGFVEVIDLHRVTVAERVTQ